MAERAPCSASSSASESNKENVRTHQRTRWSIEDFERGRLLGSGRFGNVFAARERRSGEEVALKVMNAAQLKKERMVQQVKREIEIHASLRHKNILRLHGFFYDVHNIYIVLEVAPGGELYKVLTDALEKGEALSERQVANYMSQMVQALDYCHRKNIIHRDIKPENLLIGHDGEIRMSDFGWSVEASGIAPRTTLCGTTDYLAPEMLNRTGHGLKTDVWCLGVLCYELLYGSPPFEEESLTSTCNRIRKVDFNFPTTRQVSEEAKHLISQLLKGDPKLRPSLKEVAGHPWITQHCGAGAR